ncbi:FkbM family methyltransferase [Methylophaga sp.]|uniref:FkbM family methyltransferase n=1 Tax=Methylophaga sp. TaxID=2024840 RepID=UPI0013FECEDA|nr:FkbM family methyltransferase [Methylophaga sp.]MTI64697.1 FkbM family methyltransferase [Methylophaga sp.]
MSFISYAQNFEDVILMRVFKDIDVGFYIDVGANDPEVDSVTKAFYDKGWHGINIEPVQSWFKKLEKGRPKDINLNCAVGNEEDELVLYEIPDTGISTLEKEIADRHSHNGYQIIEHKVQVQTVTNICRNYHTPPIHFLKIDVEGHEKSVLEGIDFSVIRPWVVVVESTLPNTQTEVYQDWEQLVLEADYQFVYFDGLNRFYLATERQELRPAFSTPPNVFDGFVLSGAGNHSFCHKLQQSIADKDEEVRELNTKVSTLEKQSSELKQTNDELSSVLDKSESASQQGNEYFNEILSRNEALVSELAVTKQSLDRLKTEQNDLAQKLNESLSNAHNWFERAKHAESQLENLQSELNEAHKLAHRCWQHATHQDDYIQALHRSTSWRVTAPLRGFKASVIRLLKLPLKLLKNLIRPSVYLGLKWVLNKPELRDWLSSKAKNYSKLHQHLRQFAINRGLVPSPPAGVAESKELRNTAQQSNEITALYQSQGTEPDLLELTPRARQIYSQLKTAVEQQNGSH